MSKFFKSLLLLLSAGLFTATGKAAEPIATWTNFSDENLTQGGITLNLNGNTVATDDSSVTIGETAGLTVSGLNIQNWTIVVDVENAPATGMVLDAKLRNSNYIGLYSTNNNLKSRWTDNLTWGTCKDNWAPTNRQLITMTYSYAGVNDSPTGTSIYINGAFVVSHTGLRTNSNLDSFVIGLDAQSRTEENLLATGMKVYSVRLYDTRLLDAEAPNYQTLSSYAKYSPVYTVKTLADDKQFHKTVFTRMTDGVEVNGNSNNNWQVFASQINGSTSTKYGTTGATLRLTDAVTNCASNASFTPLSLTGLIVEKGATGNSLIGSGDRNTELGDVTGEGFTSYFTLSEDFTIERDANKTTTFYGKCVFEIDAEKTFTINNQNCVINKNASLTIQNGGTIAIAKDLTINEGVTLDVSGGEIIVTGSVEFPLLLNIASDNEVANETYVIKKTDDSITEATPVVNTQVVVNGTAGYRLIQTNEGYYIYKAKDELSNGALTVTGSASLSSLYDETNYALPVDATLTINFTENNQTFTFDNNELTHFSSITINAAEGITGCAILKTGEGVLSAATSIVSADVAIAEGVTLGAVTVDVDKTLTVKDNATVNAIATDSKGTLVIDATGGAITVSDATKTSIRESTNMTIVLKGAKSSGVTLNYLSDELHAVNEEFGPRLKVESGTHTFGYGNENQNNFATGDSDENPTIEVASGAKLDFEIRDLSGWQSVSAQDKAVLKVRAGGELEFKDHGSYTAYFRDRLYIEGATDINVPTTVKIANSNQKFVPYGGTDEATAQFYVPAGKESAPTYAKVAGAQIKTDQPNGATGGFAISVGANSTLFFETPLTAGTQNVKKYGAGTLVLSGSNTANSSLSIEAGELSLTGSGSWAGPVTIAADATLVGSGTITDALTFNEGAILDATAGVLTVSGAVNLPSTLKVKITEEQNVTGSVTLLNAANATIPEGGITVSVVGETEGTNQYAVEKVDGGLKLTVTVPACKLTWMPIGDSITEGESTDVSYRHVLWNKLTQAGYDIQSVGVRNGTHDHTLTTEAWSYHNAFYGARINTGSNTRQRLSLDEELEVCGYPDIITVLLGANDVSDNAANVNKDDASVTALVERWVEYLDRLATLRPNSQIFVGTVMNFKSTHTKASTVEPFNERIRELYDAKAKPFTHANVTLVELNKNENDEVGLLADTEFVDPVHPNAAGCEKVATRFYEAIVAKVFRTDDAGAVVPEMAFNDSSTSIKVLFDRPLDATAASSITATLTGVDGITLSDPVVSDDGRTLSLTASSTLPVLSDLTVTMDNVVAANATSSEDVTATFTVLGTGVEENIPVSIREGFVPYVKKSIGENDRYNGSVTYDDEPAEIEKFGRVAYYMELKREGQPAQFVWVAMDAFTHDIREIGIPTSETADQHKVVTGLTMYANRGNFIEKNLTTAGTGFIEFTSKAITKNDSDITGAPSDASAYDWNDTFTSGAYGCMQISRVLTGAYAPAEMIFAFNRFTHNSDTEIEVGIGSFSGHLKNDGNGLNSNSIDRTFLSDADWNGLMASDYSVRLLEVWVTPLVEYVIPVDTYDTWTEAVEGLKISGSASVTINFTAEDQTFTFDEAVTIDAVTVQGEAGKIALASNVEVKMASLALQTNVTAPAAFYNGCTGTVTAASAETVVAVNDATEVSLTATIQGGVLKQVGTGTVTFTPGAWGSTQTPAKFEVANGTLTFGKSTTGWNNPPQLIVSGGTLDLNNVYTFKADDGSGYLTTASPVLTMGGATATTIQGGAITPYTSGATEQMIVRYLGNDGTNAPATFAANIHSVYTNNARTRSIEVGKGAQTDGYDLEVTGTIGLSGGEYNDTTLKKTGAGTLLLSGTNNFPKLQIAEGVLKLGRATALSDKVKTITIDEGATLDLNGQAITLTGVTISGAGQVIDSASTKGSLTLADTSTVSVNVEGVPLVIAKGAKLTTAIASLPGNITLQEGAALIDTTGKDIVTNLGTRTITVTPSDAEGDRAVIARLNAFNDTSNTFTIANVTLKGAGNLALAGMSGHADKSVVQALEFAEGTDFSGEISVFNQYARNTQVTIAGTRLANATYTFVESAADIGSNVSGNHTLTVTGEATLKAIKQAFAENSARTMALAVNAPLTVTSNVTLDKQGSITIAAPVTIAQNATWSATNGISVTGEGTISGAGTIDSALTLADGATIDATNGVVTANTIATLPTSLKVGLPDAAEMPFTLLNTTAFAGNEGEVKGVTLTVNGEQTGDYLLNKTATALTLDVASWTMVTEVTAEGDVDSWSELLAEMAANRKRFDTSGGKTPSLIINFGDKPQDGDAVPGTFTFDLEDATALSLTKVTIQGTNGGTIQKSGTANVTATATAVNTNVEIAANAMLLGQTTLADGCTLTVNDSDALGNATNFSAGEGSTVKLVDVDKSTLNLANLTNAAGTSNLILNNVKAYIYDCKINTLTLEGNFQMNNGNSTYDRRPQCITINTLTGAGEFLSPTTNLYQAFNIKNVENYTGSLDLTANNFARTVFFFGDAPQRFSDAASNANTADDAQEYFADDYGTVYVAGQTTVATDESSFWKLRKLVVETGASFQIKGWATIATSCSGAVSVESGATLDLRALNDLSGINATVKAGGRILVKSGATVPASIVFETGAILGICSSHIDEIGSATLTVTADGTAKLVATKKGYKIDGVTELGNWTDKDDDTTDNTLSFGYDPVFDGELCWWAYEFDEDENTTLSNLKDGPDNTGRDKTSLEFDGKKDNGELAEGRILVGDEYVDNNDGTKALRLAAAPHRTVSAYPTAFTATVYGKLTSQSDTILLGFGSTYNRKDTIALVTGTSPNEVNLIWVKGSTSTEHVSGSFPENCVTTLATTTVPNGTTENHLFGFSYELKDTDEDGTKDTTEIIFYVDGDKYQPYKVKEIITLGGGFQAGSLHGGWPREGIAPTASDWLNRMGDNEADKAATIEFLRVYDKVLPEETFAAMAKAYSYISKVGRATRTIVAGADSTWHEATDWEQTTARKDGEDYVYDENGALVFDTANVEKPTYGTSETPEIGTQVFLNVDGENTLYLNEFYSTTTDAETGKTTTIGNSKLYYERLEINGVEGGAEDSLTMWAGRENPAVAEAYKNSQSAVITVLGYTKINTNVTLPHNVAYLSGPVAVAEGKTLTFDFSKFDVMKVPEMPVEYRLTGFLDEATRKDRVTHNYPDEWVAVNARSVDLSYRTDVNQYVFRVDRYPLTAVFTNADDYDVGMTTSNQNTNTEIDFDDLYYWWQNVVAGKKMDWSATATLKDGTTITEDVFAKFGATGEFDVTKDKTTVTLTTNLETMRLSLKEEALKKTIPVTTTTTTHNETTGEDETTSTTTNTEVDMFGSQQLIIGDNVIVTYTGDAATLARTLNEASAETTGVIRTAGFPVDAWRANLSVSEGTLAGVGKISGKVTFEAGTTLDASAATVDSCLSAKDADLTNLKDITVDYESVEAAGTKGLKVLALPEDNTAQTLIGCVVTAVKDDATSVEWSESGDDDPTLVVRRADGIYVVARPDVIAEEQTVDNDSLTLPLARRAAELSATSVNLTGVVNTANIEVKDAPVADAAEVFTNVAFDMDETPDANGAVEAKLMYDFGVTKIGVVTINDTEYVVAEIVVSNNEDLNQNSAGYVDGATIDVTVTLGNVAQDVTVEAAADMTGATVAPAAELPASTRYVRFPMPEGRGTWKIKARVKKSTPAQQ